MCGIAGMIGSPDHALLREMVRRLTHRGPDDQGTTIAGPVGLGATRLSLIDFDHGKQPLSSNHTTHSIAFNGEIYNHDELRRYLKRTYQCHFAGASDTEVVLQGFECEGPSFLDRLEGMFGVAITDGTTLWLARDSFGMKPLFYWVDERSGHLAFASEIKALLADPRIPRRLNWTALVEFATFGFLLGDSTCIEGVRQLTPNELVIIKRQPDATLSISHHPRPVKQPEPFGGTRADAVDVLIDLLRHSVTEQLMADHPVGCFLSGGIDSTILGALASTRVRVPTFTASDHPDLVDLGIAEQVAGHIGADHHRLQIDPSAFSDAIPFAVAATELPMMPSIALMSAVRVRQASKAVLCGDGADELFAGYGIHLQPERLVAFYERNLNRVQALLPLAAGERNSTDAALSFLREGPADQKRPRTYHSLQADQLSNLHLWLWDRGSMASGLEVRLPYMNTKVRQFARSIPLHWHIAGDQTKTLLREVLFRLLPTRLWEAVAVRKKEAASDAVGRCFAACSVATTSILEEGYRDRHPLRPFFMYPAQILAFDAFLYSFVIHDGVPERCDLSGMYRRYGSDLQDAHEHVRKAINARGTATSEVQLTTA